MIDKKKYIFIGIFILITICSPVLIYFGSKGCYAIIMLIQYKRAMNLYYSTSSWSELDSKLREHGFYVHDKEPCFSSNLVSYNCAWPPIFPPFSSETYVFNLPDFKYIQMCHFIVDDDKDKVIDVKVESY